MSQLALVLSSRSSSNWRPTNNPKALKHSPFWLTLFLPEFWLPPITVIPPAPPLALETEFSWLFDPVTITPTLPGLERVVDVESVVVVDDDDESNEPRRFSKTTRGGWSLCEDDFWEAVVAMAGKAKCSVNDPDRTTTPKQERSVASYAETHTSE